MNEIQPRRHWLHEEQLRPRDLSDEILDELPVEQPDLLQSTNHKYIFLMVSTSLLFGVLIFCLCRKFFGFTRHNENRNTWQGDYEYCNVVAEYDELLEDTFNNDEITQEGDSDEESLASILSEYSGDGKKFTDMEMEMTTLDKTGKED